MKRATLLMIFIALIGGCAYSAPDGGNYAGGWMTPQGVPMDPTYPGAGTYVGIGVGGGVGGLGFGLGF